jgi:hypothetical protein
MAQLKAPRPPPPSQDPMPQIPFETVMFVGPIDSIWVRGEFRARLPARISLSISLNSVGTSAN